MINSKTFRLLCIFIFFIFSTLMFSPLLSLSYGYENTIVNTSATSSTNNKTEDSAKDLNLSKTRPYSTIEDEALLIDKPVYDIYTVSERLDQNLSTCLPKVSPIYKEKIIYLTFDDGPDPDNTPKILDILKSNGVKATFFVVGCEVEKSPQILKRIFDEGHAIGNHSYNHNYRQLYKSTESYTLQLNKTDELIKKVIGVRPVISRAPGGSAGSFTKQYWNTLIDRGYVDIGWNISSGDASNATAEQIINRIIYQTENKYLWSHAILLMHDGSGHAETVRALPSIINYYKNLGFEFGVINLFTPPPW